MSAFPFSDESDLDDNDDDYLGQRTSALYNHSSSHSRSPRTLSSSSTQDSHSPRPTQINGACKYPNLFTSSKQEQQSGRNA